MGGRTNIGHRVLLSVEDDDAEYHIIKMAVEKCGIPIQVCRVADGEEALLFLQKTRGYELAPRPDLILLNLNLPKRDGFEVLTDIRDTDALRSIPVIIFTSSSLTSERQKALDLGAADFISKPGTLDGLLETIRSVCFQFLTEPT
jgi:two-component system, chemotaxis family, response regulator Rcp1